MKQILSTEDGDKRSESGQHVSLCFFPPFDNSSLRPSPPTITSLSSNYRGRAEKKMAGEKERQVQISEKKSNDPDLKERRKEDRNREEGGRRK